jgi:hypothetical protein
MSGKVSARLNTNGLLFYIDGANSNSYTGTNLVDIAGSRIGTFSSSISLDNSVYGNIPFNGTDNFITYTLYDNNIISNLTIDCWVNTTSTGTASQIFPIIFWNSYDTNNLSTNFTLSWENNSFGFYYNDSNTTYRVLSTTASIIGSWVNPSVTYDGTNATFYLNGTLLSTSTASISSDPTTDYYFQGNISNVRVYDRTLSSDEILQNYNFNNHRFN